MNLPQRAGCKFLEIINIMYCQKLFSLYDTHSSVNPQATVRARITEKKVKGTQRQDHRLLALVVSLPIQLPLKSTAPPELKET